MFKISLFTNYPRALFEVKWGRWRIGIFVWGWRTYWNQCGYDCLWTEWGAMPLFYAERESDYLWYMDGWHVGFEGSNLPGDHPLRVDDLPEGFIALTHKDGESRMFTYAEAREVLDHVPAWLDKAAEGA